MLAAPPPPPASTQPGARPRATGTAEVRNDATPASRRTRPERAELPRAGYTRGSARDRGAVINPVNPAINPAINPAAAREPERAACCPTKIEVTLYLAVVTVLLAGLWLAPWETAVVKAENSMQLEFSEQWKQQSSAASGDYVLSPALKKVLEEAETQYGDELLDWDGEMEEAAKEEEQEGTGPTRTPEERKREAEAEVKRILSSRGTVRDILGEGMIQDQKREYRRIALLIHPDKNLVSGDKANFAYRLLNAVNKKLQER
eukprot:TRINITY_DN7046_c0_g1_i2.p1 TRINITY_DN7046_c0_g1~~TRINITY_DN7046_c0_g1_i2.p1  ORF type:complete len:278 (-),score=49.10 TRINITY_DN7046_c0_g1_i2:64-846(-)